MNYEIVYLKEMLIAGQTVRTINENAKATNDIGQAWSTYFQTGLYEQTKNKVNKMTLGVYYDYESDAMAPYTFMTGCQVSQIEKDNLTTIEIPKGKYAKFTVNGDIMIEVIKAWQSIWSMDLKRSYTFDFEMYHNNGPNPQVQEVDIYIAIE